MTDENKKDMKKLIDELWEGIENDKPVASSKHKLSLVQDKINQIAEEEKGDIEKCEQILTRYGFKLVLGQQNGDYICRVLDDGVNIKIDLPENNNEIEHRIAEAYAGFEPLFMAIMSKDKGVFVDISEFKRANADLYKAASEVAGISPNPIHASRLMSQSASPYLSIRYWLETACPKMAPFAEYIRDDAVFETISSAAITEASYAIRPVLGKALVPSEKDSINGIKKDVRYYEQLSPISEENLVELFKCLYVMSLIVSARQTEPAGYYVYSHPDFFRRKTRCANAKLNRILSRKENPLNNRIEERKGKYTPTGKERKLKWYE